MLLELNISNFALIDKLNIEFRTGLHIITGETGAGKSILIDAVQILLGERASTDFIRKGNDSALVEGTFDISKISIPTEILEGIGLEEETELIISREIFINGKNKCRVNGRTITISMLKELGEYLVDFHGQHEHQSLFKISNHLDFLDSFGGFEIQNLRNEFRKIADAIKGLSDQKKKLLSDLQEGTRLQELYSYQLDEIEQADLKNGEEDELLAQRKLLLHAEKLFSSISEASGLLGEGMNGFSILGGLHRLLASVTDASKIDSQLEKLKSEIENVFYSCEEFHRELSQYLGGIEFNPDKLAEIETRLNVLNQIKRKYGGSIDEAIAYKEKIVLFLDNFQNGEEKLREIEKKIDDTKTSAAKIAINLSKIRKTKAKALEKAIMAELADLNMERTVLVVDFSYVEDQDGLNYEGQTLKFFEYGIDKVEFLISPNPGEEPKPLAKIASGGELARIMLGIKTILSNVDGTDTLVFDEVDTGVGGRAAQAVAQKLANLSKHYQILCVTHLPQIASMADLHFRVSKEVKDDRTFTSIKNLDHTERTEELARMLGGTTLTDLTMKHAMEMIELAAKFKSEK